MSQAVSLFENPGVVRAEDRRIGSAIVLVAAVMSIAAFAWLAAQVLDGRVIAFDLHVRALVHQHISAPWLPLMLALSAVGSAAALVTVSVVLVVWFRRIGWHDASVTLAVSMLGVVGLDLGLKHIFHRARPTAFFGTLPDSYSFPSGHALACFCFFVVLAAVLAPHLRRTASVLLWIAAAVLVPAVGLSRVWLGVHYPSDVIGGYLVAAAWVCVVCMAGTAGWGRMTSGALELGSGTSRLQRNNRDSSSNS